MVIFNSYVKLLEGMTGSEAVHAQVYDGLWGDITT